MLRGGDDHDVLIGGTGNDFLYGGAGNDVLFGGEGDWDYFYGGPGADLMVGSGGSKVTAFYNLSTEGVTVNLATRRGQGGEAEGDELIGIPRVLGSKYGDTLTGDEQDNYFWWTRGADVVDGGGGIDILSYLSLPSDWGVTVDLGVTDAEGWTTATGGDGEDDKLKNIENLDGSRGADTLRGDQNANKFYGTDGRDVLEDRGGADLLNGGWGPDTASYAHSPGGGGVTVDLTLTGPQATENNHDAAGDTLIGIEWLEGSNHSDRLTGDGGRNWLTGGAGIGYLYGGDGDDTLYGEVDPLLFSIDRDSSERLYGYPLPNFLFGEDGNDYLFGGKGNDQLEGGDGHDVLFGWAGHDWLKGGDEYDRLYGQAGIDVLEGGAGNNMLYGGTETDHLHGDAGADALSGGTGADTFFFGQESVVDTGNAEETRTLSDETDTVKDFTQSEGDRLDLRGLKDHSLFTEGTMPGTELSLLETKGAAFTGVKGQVKWWQDGGQTHMQVDLDGTADANGEYDAEFQVTLDGLHDLTGADFILA